MVGTAIAVAACGEGKRKTAKDPSEENTPSASSANEEAPKWEGASRVEETPAKSSSGGATVHEAPSQLRHDSPDKDATEVPLKRATRQVKDNCGAARDDNGKATGPWGKVTIKVMLGHNGHSKEVTIPEPYNDKPVGRCIEKAFTNLTFPPWSGPDTQVDREVELVEPGKEKK